MEDVEVLGSITSPEELSAILRRLQPEKKELLRFFYIVATHRRIELMDVFFNPTLYQDGYEGITLQDLLADPSTFVALLDNIIEEGHIDIIAYFLEKGLDPDFGVIVDRGIATVLTGSPLLSLACLAKKIDIMKLLLSRGADPNQRDDHYETPASYAMLTDDVRVLNLLVVHGADLCCLNEDGGSLWSSTLRDGYDPSTETNFRRLAEKGIYPNKVDYYHIYHLAQIYPCYEALLALMEEVMEKNGISFEEDEYYEEW